MSSAKEGGKGLTHDGQRHLDELEAAVKLNEARILQLTAGPQVIATVISIQEIALPVQRATPASLPNPVPAGTRLYIRESHEPRFAGKEAVVHETQAPRDGFLYVQIGSEYTNVAIEDVDFIDAPRRDDANAEPPELETVATMTVAHEGKHLVVRVPPAQNFSPGDAVLLMLPSLQVVGPAPVVPVGPVVTVESEPVGNRCEVRHRDGTILIHLPSTLSTVRAGDRLSLDPFATVAVSRLASVGTRYEFLDETGVSFADVIGQTQAKQELTEALLTPAGDPQGYAAYRIKRARGGLIHGPEGCGKTLLMRGLITELRRAYGKAPNALLVRGPELFRGIVGEMEALIRELFAYGLRLFRDTGIPTHLIIDECEALFKKRGTGVSSDVNDMSVTQFLPLMDGFTDSGCVCLLLTNRLDILDDAITRPGRMDFITYVGRPTADDTEALLAYYLHPDRARLAADQTVEALASWGRQHLFSPQNGLYEVILPPAAADQPPRTETFTLGDVGSGATVDTSIVNRAKKAAYARHRQDPATPDGITQADLAQAIATLRAELMAKNLEKPLADFVRRFTDDVMSVEFRKLRQQER